MVFPVNMGAMCRTESADRLSASGCVVHPNTTETPTYAERNARHAKLLSGIGTNCAFRTVAAVEEAK